MKTNHQRGFCQATHRQQGGYGTTVRLPLGKGSVGAWMSYEFSNGNRGMARAKRGLKKFLRSRFRADRGRHIRQDARESTLCND